MYLKILLMLFMYPYINCAITDYFNDIKSFFTYSNLNERAEDVSSQVIPYEVSETDDKFIEEAVKLTGVDLSELDSCQHRVVMKLQTTCHKMNDEQLAKLAVMLLNCQSFIEGRTLYPCTDAMSIKECTINMDSDTWNSYHITSNRARAVCYQVRQVQFRGITEQTINHLVDSARSQLNTLGKISKEQQNLNNFIEDALSTISQGQEVLENQQTNIAKAQFHGQLIMENNIMRLLDEKQLIADSQKQLKELADLVKDKFELATFQLKKQSDENLDYHQRILDDLVSIQYKTAGIFQKIEESLDLSIKQHEMTQTHYQLALAQIKEVIDTIDSLVMLVQKTKLNIDERLLWFSNALGGVNVGIDRLLIIFWHLIFLLISMVCCAFFKVRMGTRLIVVGIPMLNLATAYHGEYKSFSQLNLLVAILTLIIVKFVIISSKNGIIYSMISYLKTKLHFVQIPDKGVFHINQQESNIHEKCSSSRDSTHSDEHSENASQLHDLNYARNFRSHTPVNLNGQLRRNCLAKTRAGNLCKLSSLPGRAYCHRHQYGDSVGST